MESYVAVSNKGSYMEMLIILFGMINSNAYWRTYLDELIMHWQNGFHVTPLIEEIHIEKNLCDIHSRSLYQILLRNATFFLKTIPSSR